jgi:hypothetical protein
VRAFRTLRREVTRRQLSRVRADIHTAMTRDPEGYYAREQLWLRAFHLRDRLDALR